MKGNIVFLAVCLWVSCDPVRGDFSTIINVPPDGLPASIGSDTQLNIAAGAVIPNNYTVGAINGSSTNIEVNITGGTIGTFFLVYGDSTVNVSDGTFGNRFWLHDGSTANVTGGTFGPNVICEDGCAMNVFGGNFINEVHALFRGDVYVWGGDIEFLQVHEQATASFYGKQFFLDGLEIEGLVPGQPFVIEDRDVAFTGILADGTPFDFDLISEHVHNQNGPDQDHFHENAVLTVTIVASADFNLDLNVDGQDLDEWENAYGTNDLADADGDGDSDGADFLAWQSQYTGEVGGLVGAAAVPEPGAAALLLVASVCAIALKSRRFQCRMIVGARVDVSERL